MASDFTVRRAEAGDAADLLAIYRPFVERTAISFEIAAPTIDEFEARIARALDRYQWLVAERDGQRVGYAYGSAHREREAYRWSVEVSAYVSPAHHGLGIGKALYASLLRDLADMGYCNAFAVIAMPNDPSIALHRSVGFEPVGVFRAVGRKFDAWHDVTWMQRTLRPNPPQ